MLLGQAPTASDSPFLTAAVDQAGTSSHYHQGLSLGLLRAERSLNVSGAATIPASSSPPLIAAVHQAGSLSHQPNHQGYRHHQAPTSASLGKCYTKQNDENRDRPYYKPRVASVHSDSSSSSPSPATTDDSSPSPATMGDPTTYELLVGGKRLRCLYDTGANVSLIREDVLHGVSLFKSDDVTTTLHLATHKPLKSIGLVRTTIEQGHLTRLQVEQLAAHPFQLSSWRKINVWIREEKSIQLGNSLSVTRHGFTTTMPHALSSNDSIN